MLISTHLPPPVITERTALLAATTHILCCSYAIYLSAAASSENDQGNELGFKDCPGRFDPSIERSRHPAQHRTAYLPLHIRKDLTSIGLIPASVQLLGGNAKLDDDIAGQVLRLDLAALLSPQSQEGGLVLARDDPSVRAADEVAAIGRTAVCGCLRRREHSSAGALRIWLENRG